MSRNPYADEFDDAGPRDDEDEGCRCDPRGTGCLCPRIWTDAAGFVEVPDPEPLLGRYLRMQGRMRAAREQQS